MTSTSCGLQIVHDRDRAFDAGARRSILRAERGIAGVRRPQLRFGLYSIGVIPHTANAAQAVREMFLRAAAGRSCDRDGVCRKLDLLLAQSRLDDWDERRAAAQGTDG